VESDFDIGSDRTKTFILLLYVIFIILLHIILLNMLIAIMNDSYSYINRKHDQRKYTCAAMSIVTVI